MLRQIVRYASYMLGANVLVALFTFFVGMLGAKTRSLESFGDYTTYLLLYNIGGMIVTGGTNQTIQKFGAVSAEARLKFAGLAYRFGGFLLLFCTVVGLAATLIGGRSVGLGIIIVPFFAALHWTRSILRSQFDARYEARLVIVASLSKSIPQLFLLVMSESEEALIWGDFLGQASTGIICFFFLAYGIGARLKDAISAKVDRQFLIEVGRFILPLWVAGEVYNARSSFLQTWTRIAMGPAKIAVLGMAEQLWRIATKPAELFGQAALPGLVQAEKRSEVYRSALAFSILVLPVLGLFAAGFAPLLLELFEVGGKYPQVPAILALYALSMPGAAVETTFIQFTVAEGEGRAVLYAQLFTMAIMALMIFPFADRLGILGVAAVGAFGHTSYLAGLMMSLRKSHADEVYSALSFAVRGTLCMVCALAVLFFAWGHPMSWVATLPAALIYVIGLWICKALKGLERQSSKISPPA